MSAGETGVDWTALADEPEQSPEQASWLSAHPTEAQEIELARRVRLLLAELRTFPVTIPPDFEARLMARCRQDTTILHLLDLWLSRGSQALVELLGTIFNVLPDLLLSSGATATTRR